ncbi:MAG: hypothetical protein IJ153_05735 [Clostridia bacterium]|nr:hypothetical protein [Clostridia bacterium]
MNDEQLKAFLLMFNAETAKSLDWLRDMFHTIDKENLPDVDHTRLVDAMVGMVDRKMEDYPEIWNDITWILPIHQRLLKASESAYEKGTVGDEDSMLSTIVLVGWMEAFKRRFEELGDKNDLDGGKEAEL